MTYIQEGFQTPTQTGPAPTGPTFSVDDELQLKYASTPYLLTYVAVSAIAGCSFVLFLQNEPSVSAILPAMLLGLFVFTMLASGHFFSRPTSTKSWIAQAILGARVYALRRENPIPDEAGDTIFRLQCAYYGMMAVFVIAAPHAPLSTILTMAALLTLLRVWIADRCVLLFQHMKQINMRYAAWEY